MLSTKTSHNYLVILFSLICLGFFSTFNVSAEDGEVDSVIEINTGAPDDAKIKQRIKNIFSEIDDLKETQVEVKEGVVTISGQTANDQQAVSALGLAKRIEGVVTVNDKIERTLDLKSNIKPVFQSVYDSLDKALRALPLVLVALTLFIIICFLGFLLARWRWLWKRIAPNPFLAELIAQAVQVASLILALILSLNLVGAKALMGTILGGAGVLGLAIGFAVRDTLENYISSIMLSLRQPFRADDLVVIDDYEGVVVRLTSRATILMTRDGNHLRIPNSIVFKAVILNYTRNPERRFEFDLGVDAEDDPIAAMTACVDSISVLDFILKEPKATALIESVGDSNIVIRARGWINQSETDYYKARSLAIRAAKDALEEQGFTLPEPIYRLRFDDINNSQLTLHSGPIDSANTSVEAADASKAVKSKVKKQAKEIDAASVDVSPDTHLEERAQQERAEKGSVDLLDEDRPVE